MTSALQYPEFLHNADAFSAHLLDLFIDEDNAVKGSAFLEFAMKLVPFFQLWDGFAKPEPSPKQTHDHGVDFTGENDDTPGRIAGQSKFRIRSVKDLASIIDNFQHYERHQANVTSSTQQVLALDGASTKLSFVIITSSKLENIVKKYRNSGRSSSAYLAQLANAGRIHILDGPTILEKLRALYKENYIHSENIRLPLNADYIKSGDVYLSVVSGQTLSELYQKHGSSLFFENIREFLGHSEDDKEGESVNNEIRRTLLNQPERMLSRNNGITIRADKVVVGQDNCLTLHGSSIVNGCQTTMCIVAAGAAAYQAEVLVKIVEGGDSWGFSLPRSEEERTVSNVLESIHRDRVSYDAIRALYLGIFSRSPNNMWHSNYSEVRLDILDIFGSEHRDEQLLNSLFKLLVGLRTAIANLKKRHEHEDYAQLFKRFFDDRKPQYQCMLGLLAICGIVDISLIDKKPDARAEYERLLRFIQNLAQAVEAVPDAFEIVLNEAFVLVAEKIIDSCRDEAGPNEIAQAMHKETLTMAGSKRFAKTLSKLRMRMRSRDGLIQSLPPFE